MANMGSTRPYGLQWRSNTFFILSTVTVGLFTDLFLYGLVVPVLPFILSERVGVPHSEIQYYTSLLLACYAGASVVFSLPAGIIADRLSSRQLPFLVGLAALLGSTILLAIGRTIPILIIARLLQGTSAATVWTIGMALVMDTVGSDKLGVTIGTIFSIISVGELASPLLGGIVYKKAGSTALFGMGFGLLAIDFVMRLVLIEKKSAAKYGKPESEEDTEEEVEDPEANEEDPLLGKHDELEDWKIPTDQANWVKSFPVIYCLRNPSLLTSMLLAFTQATLVGVFDATIPTEAQDLFNFDSLRAGLIFAPLVIPYLLLGPLAGRGIDRFGTTGVKYFATLGLLYISIPIFLLRLPQPSTSSSHTEIIKFAALLSFCGIGLAFFSAPSLVEASNIIEKYHKANTEFFGELGPYAQLYAINSIFFCLGLTIGPLVAGELRVRVGYGNMNACVAGLCLVVSGCCFAFLGGKPGGLRRWRR